MSNFIGPNKTEKVSGTTIVPANAIRVSLALRHDSIAPVNHLVRYKELKLDFPKIDLSGIDFTMENMNAIVNLQ